MLPSYLSEDKLNYYIREALKEDIGYGDFSSLACIPENATAKFACRSKESALLAGIDVAEEVLKSIDVDIKYTVLKKDGVRIEKGDIVLEAEGRMQSLLRAERLLLNFIQRMSGIATITRQYVDKVAHTKAKILDTRKTTPNFRAFEKWAVKIGGGENHRFGLFDLVMLKDNHVDLAGGITNSIKTTKEYLDRRNLKLAIEVETRNLDEVKQAMEIGMIKRIMLDNMSIQDIKKAVKIIDGKYEIEASGGVTLKTVKEIAEAGVDYISVGALTHSYQSIDLSFKTVK
ncbi:MAG: carboxylating nicotinate-nucleotide diphosphorylase [Cytophagales bacterium]|nr:carboxylating nicotinate-nucleotide diphosphorylase [Cytophagales bacterium]